MRARLCVRVTRARASACVGAAVAGGAGPAGQPALRRRDGARRPLPVPPSLRAGHSHSHFDQSKKVILARVKKRHFDQSQKSHFDQSQKVILTRVKQDWADSRARRARASAPPPGGTDLALIRAGRDQSQPESIWAGSGPEPKSIWAGSGAPKARASAPPRPVRQRIPRHLRCTAATRRRR